MTNTAYIYGAHNGLGYTDDSKTGVAGLSRPGDQKVHWDPRISVKTVAENFVQIGVVPPSKERSTPEEGVWVNDDGQFLSLDRAGMRRLIQELQDAAVSTFGRDPW